MMDRLVLFLRHGNDFHEGRYSCQAAEEYVKDDADRHLGKQQHHGALHRKVSREVDPAPHDGGQSQDRGEFSYLRGDRVGQQLPCVIAVNVIGDDRGRDLPVDHRDDPPAIGDEYHRRDHRFLVDFQPEKEIRSAHGDQHVEVDRVERIQQADHAKQLQIGDAGQPFFRQHHEHQWLCHDSQADHQGEVDHCQGGQGLADAPLHPLLVVLDRGEYGKGDAPDRGGEIFDGQLLGLLRAGVVAEVRGRKQFPYDDEVQVVVDRVQQPGKEQLRTEREHGPQRIQAEYPGRTPGQEHPEQRVPEQVAADGLGDKAPDAVPVVCHGDPDGTGKGGRDEADLHLGLEVDPFREKGGMNDPECVDDQIQRENPGQRGEKGYPVEGGDPRGREEQCPRNEKTGEDVEIEDRAFIQVAGVLFLDQGRAEPARDEGLGDRHEDRQHRDQAELFGEEQAGKDDRDDELDPLLPDPLEEAPEQPLYGVIFQQV